MDIQTLQKHVLTLATIEETDAPMVSCYLNLEKGLPPPRGGFSMSECVCCGRPFRRHNVTPSNTPSSTSSLASRRASRRRVWGPLSLRGMANGSSFLTSSSAYLCPPG